MRALDAILTAVGFLHSSARSNGLLRFLCKSLGTRIYALFLIFNKPTA